MSMKCLFVFLVHFPTVCSLTFTCKGSLKKILILHFLFWVDGYVIPLLTFIKLLLMFSCSGTSDSLTSWTVACQASLSFTISLILLKVMSIELIIPSSRLILCRPFLLMPFSFPASGSFPISLLFTSDGQSVRASGSVLPMNI